jgi:hypothetical protein
MMTAARIRYVCTVEVLPLVEAMLAANGFAVEVPMERSIEGHTCMVMSCGAATVLLLQNPGQANGEIEAWGEVRAHVAQLLETTPIDVQQLPCS